VRPIDSVPPRPDPPPRRDPLVIPALLLAAVALLLSVPAIFLLSDKNGDGFSDLTGGAAALHTIALILGPASLVLAMIVGRRIRRAPADVKGTGFKRMAITIAWLGACIWILPFCEMAGEGL
jgi:hypothetical protein